MHWQDPLPVLLMAFRGARALASAATDGGSGSLSSYLTGQGSTAAAGPWLPSRGHPMISNSNEQIYNLA